MHPYYTSSDLWSWDLLRETLGWDFAWTMVAEAAVFVLVFLRLRARRGRWRNRDRHFGLDELHRPTEAAWWLLPIYVWALEGHLQTVQVLDAFSTGLVSPPFSWVLLGLYKVFLALGCLVVVQTLLVAATGGQALSLGVEGRARAAATAAVLTVPLDILLYLGVCRWFVKETAGAL